jgi:3-methyladenine DNA glycosylase Tag
LSWAFIDARWERYAAEFDAFDVAKVAAYDEAAVARLMQAADIVHSRAKIEATIRNARALLAIEREFGSVRAYQTAFASYDELRRDTAKRFAYLGDMNTYYWLFRTGAPVPDVDVWMKTQQADHPRIREMVRHHRAQATNGSFEVTEL